MDHISDEQIQTMNAFSYKWGKHDTFSSSQYTSVYRDWLVEKYFDNNEKMIDRLFEQGNILLDAGCGSGSSAFALFGDWLDDIEYIGVDISDSIYQAEKNYQESGFKGKYRFLQCDLNSIPLDQQVDIVFSEGVLHHTDSTRNAIINLTKILRTGGRFLFYVYAKKAPIREYTDDYIRKYIKDMSDDEAWDELMKLSRLGKALGEKSITLEVPEDIPFLGIKKGTIDLQRFFYWYLFKCFYRPDFSLDEMNHINFDWYRPLNCHRQTPEEVQLWCEEAGLQIDRMHVENAGITVVATKK